MLLVTFIEDALQISTATHKDTSCACSKRFSRRPSVLGSLTYILFSQETGPTTAPGCSETRRLPVLKPNMLSRSLVGDWLLPTPMPCAREFKKWTGWIWKNKSWNREKNMGMVGLVEINRGHDFVRQVLRKSLRENVQVFLPTLICLPTGQ